MNVKNRDEYDEFFWKSPHQALCEVGLNENVSLIIELLEAQGPRGGPTSPIHFGPPRKLGDRWSETMSKVFGKSS